ncbi:hypothetical protein [Oceaniglobus roseus]|uniref:hypothetical protein n=1 Tax=Oceaniglobus roseus TaxID=1737570 RepID=UPI000C7F6AA7|nr:hypothetical protein [Kandeliimicrobium roseum]
MGYTTFTIRWPDGREEVCRSPASVPLDFLEVGECCSVTDFVFRTRRALVRGARHAGSVDIDADADVEQMARIERAARRFEPGQTVTCLSITRSPAQ